MEIQPDAVMVEKIYIYCRHINSHENSIAHKAIRNASLFLFTASFLITSLFQFAVRHKINSSNLDKILVIVSVPSNTLVSAIYFHECCEIQWLFNKKCFVSKKMVQWPQGFFPHLATWQRKQYILVTMGISHVKRRTFFLTPPNQETPLAIMVDKTNIWKA